MIYGISETVNQYLRKENRKQDRWLEGVIDIPLEPRFCTPLVGAIRASGAMLGISRSNRLTNLTFKAKLSQLSSSLWWIDMLPSPSIVNNIPVDTDWAITVDFGRRYAYDFSPDDEIRLLFKGHILNNYVMGWMAYLTANKPAQLREYLSNVRYTDDSLAALGIDNVGIKTKVIHEEQNTQVHMSITKVGTTSVGCEPDIVALI